MSDLIAATPGDVPAGHKPLFSRIERLFTSGDYSDLKITCNGKDWEVHRAIVCPASKFFRSCCKNFKESTTRVIDLPEDDAKVVHALLTYIYTSDYNEEQTTDLPRLVFNVHVHTIGDKYGVPGLCKLAEAKFAARVETDWNTSAFAEAVQEMYATAPVSKETLHAIAVTRAVNKAPNLFTGDHSKFKEIARQVAPFAYAISEKLLSGDTATQEGPADDNRSCSNCGYNPDSWPGKKRKAKKGSYCDDPY